MKAASTPNERGGGGWKLWQSTAIFVTMDEGGGYYDSGYIQPVSFFGDGPRTPMIVVSPYARRGFVDHTYTDHVSIQQAGHRQPDDRVQFPQPALRDHASRGPRRAGRRHRAGDQFQAPLSRR